MRPFNAQCAHILHSPAVFVVYRTILLLQVACSLCCHPYSLSIVVLPSPLRHSINFNRNAVATGSTQHLVNMHCTHLQHPAVPQYPPPAQPHLQHLLAKSRQWRSTGAWETGRGAPRGALGGAPSWLGRGTLVGGGVLPRCCCCCCCLVALIRGGP